MLNWCKTDINRYIHLLFSYFTFLWYVFHLYFYVWLSTWDYFFVMYPLLASESCSSLLCMMLLFSFLFCTAFPLACPFNLRLGLLLQGSASVRKIVILQNIDFPILNIDNVIHYQQNLINEIQVNKDNHLIPSSTSGHLQIMKL